MIIRTRRRITHRRYLEEMKAKHGPHEEFHRKALRGEANRALAEEWKWIASHPERADELLTTEHSIVFSDIEDFLRLLSPERLRILDYLSVHAADPPRSINALARNLGRDYKNVYEDIHDLADVGALDLERVGNRVVPRPTVVEILFTLEGEGADAATRA